MRHNEIMASLLTMGIPRNVAQDLPRLQNDVEGLLVYGSQARGDAVADSDLDILALVPSGRLSAQNGDVSVSFYTHDQLSTGIGTLFGAHLRRDARIIFDTNGRLTAAIRDMGDVDTERLLDRVRTMSVLFSSLDRDLPRYLPGLLRQARYLLRSCLYARAIADGNPSFSVRELAIRHGDASLTGLLASRHQSKPTRRELDECLLRLRRVIGPFPISVHGSLEATVVNEWGTPSDLLSMSFMALGATGKGSDYAEVEKILL